MPDGQDTLRSRLEAIQWALDEFERSVPIEAIEHASLLIKGAQKDAVAALAILDKDHRYRCRPGCPDCDIRQSPWRSTDVRVSIVPDPVPVVSREDDGGAT